MNDERPPGDGYTSRRARAKAERRGEILVAAARLMARRGFRGVRLDDIGAEVGISGPAMYRYFASKDDVLAEMLVDISRRLHAGGREVLATVGDPGRTLDSLVGVHVDFVATEPDLISVQFRDLDCLAPGPRREVRKLQREYTEMWVDTVQEVRPGTPERATRVRVHAVFGLLNSAPWLPMVPDQELRRILHSCARGALLD